MDGDWFLQPRDAELPGVRCRISPLEEIIRSKAFVLECERYDGAVLNHLFFTVGRSFDWERLMQRFDGY